MKTTRTIALAAAIVAAASTITAPAHARGGFAVGLGLGVIGAMAAHNIARERAQAAAARDRARAYAAERSRAAARAQRAAEIRAAAAERRAAAAAAAEKRAVAAAAAKRQAAAAKAKTGADPVQVATVKGNQDEQLAAAINALKAPPAAKASPKSGETPPVGVAKVDAKPADAPAAPKAQTGDCKRFVPSAGTTISVPCAE